MTAIATMVITNIVSIVIALSLLKSALCYPVTKELYRYRNMIYYSMEQAVMVSHYSESLLKAWEYILLGNTAVQESGQYYIRIADR